MRRSFSAAIAFAAAATSALAFADDRGFVELPPSSEYLIQSPGRTDWGRPEVIAALRLVAHVWAHDHPNGPPIQWNDISLEQGGPLSPHHSHRHGVDADVITRGPNVTDVKEHQDALAGELLRLFRRYGAELIFWNGPAKGLSWVFPHAGHDDHFHVRFAPATRPTPRQVLDEDLRRGVAPLPLADIAGIASMIAEPAHRSLALGDEGDDVREVQRLLARHGHAVAVDGAFGARTDDAVRRFQREHGLRADGVVGPATLRALER